MADLMKTSNCVIQVQRNKNPIGFAIRFNVFIDNEKIGSLGFGEKLQYSVPSGTHFVQVILRTNISSEKIQVECREGGIITLLCGIRNLGFGLFLNIDLKSPTDALDARTNKIDGDFARLELNDKVEKIHVATEDISIPSGVDIKVKRERTIEHTIEYERTDLTAGGAELKFGELIGASIRHQIEHKNGKAIKESENISYEIDLKGVDHARKYKLIWKDVWRTGMIHLKDGTSFSFRFRENTELEVSE